MARLGGASESWIKWRLIGNVLDAVETNRFRLQRRTRWLAAGQFLLLVTLAPVGAYFLYAPNGGRVMERPMPSTDFEDTLPEVKIPRPRPNGTYAVESLGRFIDRLLGSDKFA